MMNTAAIRISVLVVTVLNLIHGIPCFLAAIPFVQPLPRLSGVGVIEVTDRRFRERFAKRRHAFLPFLLPDHRQAVRCR